MFPHIDLRILLDLNARLRLHVLGIDLVGFIGGNPLIRGFPAFFPLIVLWFSSDCRARRSRMLIGLLATCGALIASLWMQSHIAIHVRPILDPTLTLQDSDQFKGAQWDRLYSFPSDSATLFFP